jgi:hypothetical protein
MDKTGKIVIKPQFDLAWNVKIQAKYGYIDSRGKMIIAPQFDLGLSFKDGLALVYTGGKAGYINKQGQFVWQQTN